ASITSLSFPGWPAQLEGDAVLGEPGGRVDGAAAGGVELKMQVGPGGKTSVTHTGDLLAGGDLLADADVEGFHVAVDGNGAIVVLDADPLAETGGRTGVDDGAAHGGENRGTHDVGDVEA